MNGLDRFIAYFSPHAALRRASARQVLGYYEAARPSKQRRWRNSNPAPNDVVERDAKALRNHARFLEGNHDIVRGALRVMVNNVVGPNGIGIEPQPLRADGTVHEEYAAALAREWEKWQKSPEVTGRYRWPLAQRLMAYTWLRDGEAFAQMIAGPVPTLQYSGAVPFALELLEPDFVPLDYNDAGRSIRQGIQCNAWGRATGYYVYKTDPRDTAKLSDFGQLKRLDALNMLHVSTLDRLHQLRGVSELASVITRLEDLKDFEESERIAAKVAASLTAFVQRSDSGAVECVSPSVEKDTEGNLIPRDIGLEPGMIFDGLQPGESIGLIDTKRPNANLVSWRSGQLRAVAAGIGASYSSISRDYNGTYSAQRQELVEQWVHYAVLADEFVGMFVQPVWDRFVAVCDLAGVVRRPRDVAPVDADDCLFVSQSMPWIDPQREAAAWEALVRAGFASEVEVIRKRGGTPTDVLNQIIQWRSRTAAAGLVFSSNAATPNGAASPAKQDDEKANEEKEEEEKAGAAE